MVRAKVGEPRQPVRGRDDDLAAIGRHLDQLLSGIGSVIVVEGAAGLGKSRLLKEVVTMGRRLSIKVGSGAADPGDNVVQLAPLMEACLTAVSRSSSVQHCAASTRRPSSDIGCCRTWKPCSRKPRSKRRWWCASMTCSGPTTGRLRLSDRYRAG